MNSNSAKKIYNVVQLDEFEPAAIFNTLEIINDLQDYYYFKMHYGLIPINKNKYKLPNGGYELDEAVEAILKRRKIDRPLIFITKLPYGGRENQYEENGFWFSDFLKNFDPEVEIISSYLWENLPGKRLIQPYLLMMLACYIIDEEAGISYHDDTRGCLMDYCEKPSDTDRWFESGTFCKECEEKLYKKLNFEQIVALKRIINRALGKKSCFISKPFRREFKNIVKKVSEPLTNNGWQIKDDETSTYPRDLEYLIKLELCVSDLVIADVTSNNPNVLFEIGMAQAFEKDILLLSQNRKLPLNIKTDRTIFYKPTESGMKDLSKKLIHFAGSGYQQLQ